MEILATNKDASQDFETPWVQMKELYFAIEVKANSLDATDATVEVQYAFTNDETDGITVEESQITLDSPNIHTAIRSASPLNVPFIRVVYKHGSNTTGTITIRGDV